MSSENGDVPFPQLRYCVRCCLPETVEGIRFDERGICTGCNSSEQKMKIDWAEREKALRGKLEHYKQLAGDNYHCIVPISGGKDSCFQLYVLTRIYGIRPLAVTFSHTWYSETGRYNLQNALEKFDVDHIMYTPKRSLVNRLARKSLYAIGDACWHCHTGVGAFPLQIARRFGIRLLVWGESAAENGTKADYQNPVKFDENYFLRISSKVGTDAMVGDGIEAGELRMFRYPTSDEMREAGIEGIHLGDYVFWDDERFVEFLKKEIDWREDHVEGTYKGYKSVECRMAGVHDYMKFMKRGFGRATDHATRDVRAGILTQAEGFDLARRHDAERPGAMDMYTELTGLDESEVIRELKAQRKGAARKLG
ncbi:MAG: N-acetyl sugar amidotransferase [Candidatus Nitricoxidivorans perseverans]|uniref:N-acetyl sugar amidotransferase n=1 Tax=Candidatus Nitricoxidivorans perseverans TaxID=2975601 RepID=A0AA49IXX1_9PROT|nr:MAG: N-acetyl sugar amidotransferase [Candidatus Nitricoxidivorans perseverans]